MSKKAPPSTLVQKLSAEVEAHKAMVQRLQTELAQSRQNTQTWLLKYAEASRKPLSI
ncbi:MAG: hypothetical protein HY849_02600 [Nitrosomonadales bacterium]|nr:hypothetical protein [Nitrosomonadales bacterium]